MGTNLSHSLSEFFKIIKNSEIRVLWIGDRRLTLGWRASAGYQQHELEFGFKEWINLLFISSKHAVSWRKRKAWFSHRGCGSGSKFFELYGGVSGGENRSVLVGFLSSKALWEQECRGRKMRWGSPTGDGLDDAQNSSGVDRPLLVEASELVHQ